MDLSPGRSEHGRRLAADIDVGNGNGGAPRIVCLRCVRRTLSVVTAAREEEVVESTGSVCSCSGAN